MSGMKGKKHSEATKLKMKEAWAKKIRDGFVVSTDHLKAHKGWERITPEMRKKAVVKAANSNRGQPQPMDKVTGAHTNNKAAKYWHFINKASGYELQGKNLSQLIRDNKHMFTEKDLKQVIKRECNASTCLRNLHCPRPNGRIRESWKGWRIA